jgi:hypothetical protein
MSFYTIESKDEGFNAAAAFNVRVKESGMTAEKLLRTYINGYEKFWQTPRTHGNRALTMEQMQQVLLQDPVAMVDLMNDGTAFVEFVQSSHPEAIGTEYFPERYLTIPYVMDENGALVSLKPEWENQEEESEA